MSISINGLEIVIASLNELSLALNLLKTAAHRLKDQGVQQWIYWLDPPQERLEWLKNGLQNKEVHFLYFEDKIAAMYRLMEEDLKYWGIQHHSAYYLHSLIVHPDFKGHQLGSQIIEMVYRDAVKANKNYLRLDCDASNTVLSNYYIKQGFEIVGYKQMELSKNVLLQRPVHDRI